jgi:hypothetical protein
LPTFWTFGRPIFFSCALILPRLPPPRVMIAIVWSPRQAAGQALRLADLLDLRQADLLQLRVDPPTLAAAPGDDRDPPESGAVPLVRVVPAAHVAGAVDPGVVVQAAVRFAQRADVHAEVSPGGDAVDPDQVVVAAAPGDLPGGDQLGAVIGPGGDVQHRPRPDRAPTSHRLLPAVVPRMESLDHGGMLADRPGELPEVVPLAGVGHPEEDLPGRRLQHRRVGGGGQAGSEKKRPGERDQKQPESGLVGVDHGYGNRAGSHRLR